MTANENEFDEISRLNNELLNAQRELQGKNRQLETLNAEKNQAIGVVAHDLRNPLNLIRLCSEMLMKDAARLDADQRELLETIADASGSMAHMVNDVLDLAAIESGTLRLQPQPVELTAYVSRSVARNRILARRHNVWIDYRPDPAPITVRLDPTRFEQVLNNLLSNAMGFSPAEGRIDVRVFKDAGEAVVSVRDHGPGIPASELATLFRPFVRGRQAKTKGASTGLGLAIVKRIVEGHAARVEVHSQVGEGAMFAVHLPLD